MNVGQDSDFSEELLQKRYNSHLANDLGNLVSRLLNMGHRFAGGIIPKSEIEESEEKTVLKHWESLKAEVFGLYDSFQFHKALEKIFSFIAELNRYTELRAPWKLAKSEESIDQQRLSTTLATMSEGLRLASILLQPVMPEIAEKILNSLGQKSVELFADKLEWGDELAGSEFGEKSILFPKKEH